MVWLRPADAVVVAAAAGLVLALGIALWRPPAPGEWVEIRSADDVVRIDLAGDTTLAVAGRLGDSVVEVAGGRARFAAAPCANRVCLAAGWLSRRDDFAACAPNGISLRLRATEPGYDAINY